jgi:hypothetical protein
MSHGEILHSSNEFEAEGVDFSHLVDDIAVKAPGCPARASARFFKDLNFCSGSHGCPVRRVALQLPG